VKALLLSAAGVIIAPVALVVVVLGGGTTPAASLSPDSCVVTAVAGAGNTTPAAEVGGAKLDAEQASVVRTTIGVVKGRGLAERVGVMVIAGERQESSLRNLDHGDRDSVGVLQQRPSQGWGTPAQLQDPVYAVGKFLDRVVQVPNYLTAPLADVIQTVQRSADSSLYAKWEPLATALTAAFWSGAPTVTCSGGAAGMPPTQQAKGALERAHLMLGKPYCWVGGDANGPTHGTGGDGCDGSTAGFDCSGLTLYAWSPFLKLAHFTGDQYNEGRHVPLKDAQPGDLVFLANATDGNHHVAMIWSTTGDGTGSGEIVEAQDFNVPVHLRAWRGVNEPEAMPYAVRLAG
jgi:cell wall-associated NlpC family hydrolase